MSPGRKDSFSKLNIHSKHIECKDGNQFANSARWHERKKMDQTVNYSSNDLDNLRRLVDVFDKHIDELALDAMVKRKAMAQIATIKAQLDDEPDPVIVKRAGRTLRNITEGAIGSLIATAVQQPAVWVWVATIIKLFFLN